MMKTRQPGLTLVEFLVVAVLAAVLLGAVYQSLIVQERSYSAASKMIGDQETARTALGILEAELREVGSMGGADIGGTDIANAGSGSITFRAQRKLGVVCKLSRGENWLQVWTLGESFRAGDQLIVFVDGDSLRSLDDRWDTSYVSSISTKTEADCTARWPGVPQQLLNVPDGGSYAVLDSVRTGAPVRGYEWVTYTLADQGSDGWGLTRQRYQDEEAYLLVSGLAPPGDGLVFQYFDDAGDATTDASAVARIRITVRTDPPEGTQADATELSTTIFLRNN